MRLIALLLVLAGCDFHGAAPPEAAARDFARNIPGSTGAVSCIARDTDADGYCSCSVFMHSGSPVPIECGCDSMGVFFPPEGCRTATFKVRNTGGYAY